MRALELSDLDFAPVRSGGGSKPPLPPRPVKLGGPGERQEASRPVSIARQEASRPVSVARSESVAPAMRAAIDAIVASMVAAGDVRFDLERGEFVSTAVRWRFP